MTHDRPQPLFFLSWGFTTLCMLQTTSFLGVPRTLHTIHLFLPWESRHFAGFRVLPSWGFPALCGLYTISFLGNHDTLQASGTRVEIFGWGLAGDRSRKISWGSNWRRRTRPCWMPSHPPCLWGVRCRVSTLMQSRNPGGSRLVPAPPSPRLGPPVPTSGCFFKARSKGMKT
jgi:hypothetical protein